MSPDEILRHCLALDLSKVRYLLNPPVAQPSNPNPTLFDCSELVRWACQRAGLVPEMPDGSWFQHIHCKKFGTMTSISKAIATRGALLITSRDPNGVPIEPIPAGPPARAHIAFSLGDGRVFEARGITEFDVGINSAHNRSFSHAALIPGVTYPNAPAPLPPPPSLPGNANPRWSRATIRFGSSGMSVFTAQRLLIELGAPELKAVGATGNFYSITERAVVAFQTRVRTQHVASFSVDGICGPYTWGWLLYLSGRGTE